MYKSFFGLFSLSICLLFSCGEQEHHLLRDAATAITFQKDTIGWENTLNVLNGVWVQKKYLKTLRNTNSIHQANDLLINGFISINIDCSQFRGDSLLITSVGARDTDTWQSTITFNKLDDRTILMLKTNHPFYKDDFKDVFVTTDFSTWDTTLTLQVVGSDLLNAENNSVIFQKISHEISPKDYNGAYFRGVELFIRQEYLMGRHSLYNAAGTLLNNDTYFAKDGTMRDKPFTRYRPMSWHNIDILHFEGMSPFEENRPKNTYYGLVIRNDGFDLHHIIYDKKRHPKLGNLAFQLRKPPKES